MIDRMEQRIVKLERAVAALDKRVAQIGDDADNHINKLMHRVKDLETEIRKRR